MTTYQAYMNSDYLSTDQWKVVDHRWGAIGVQFVGKSYELKNAGEDQLLTQLRRSVDALFENSDAILKYMATNNDNSVRLVMNGAMFKLNIVEGEWEISTRHVSKHSHAIVESLDEMVKFMKDHS